MALAERMNFFEQQEQARRQTRTLLLLFALAVGTIVLSVNGAAALLWIAYKGGKFAAPHVYPPFFFSRIPHSRWA
jgi:hypothetical protein